MVAIIILYFIFIVTIKDTIVDKIYSINPYESVTDADSYWKATKLGGMLTGLFWVGLGIINLLSIILLLVKGKNGLSKWVLILIPIISIFLFMAVLIVGGFSRGWY